MDLVIFAAAKRIVDIAQRAAEGLDLRNIDRALEKGDEEERLDAILNLGKFALREHNRAKERLERALGDTHGSEYTAKERFAAAKTLSQFGDERDDKPALLLAVDALKSIVRDDSTARIQQDRMGQSTEALGDALLNVGKRERYLARQKRSRRAYRRALKIYRLVSETQVEAVRLSNKIAIIENELSKRQLPNQIRTLTERGALAVEEKAQINGDSGDPAIGATNKSNEDGELQAEPTIPKIRSEALLPAVGVDLRSRAINGGGRSIRR